MRKSGKVCVLDIDMQGVMQIKKSDLDPLLVFIKPPSVSELENRLKARKTETSDSLQRRLSVARAEIDYGKLKKKIVSLSRLCKSSLILQ